MTTTERPTTEAAVALARTIRSSAWFRERRQSLSRNEQPSLAQVVALVDRVAALPDEPTAPTLMPSAPVGVRDALHATFQPATPRGEPITERWLDTFTEKLTDELRKRHIGFSRLAAEPDGEDR